MFSWQPGSTYTHVTHTQVMSLRRQNDVHDAAMNSLSHVLHCLQELLIKVTAASDARILLGYHVFPKGTLETCLIAPPVCVCAGLSGPTFLQLRSLVAMTAPGGIYRSGTTKNVRKRLSPSIKALQPGNSNPGRLAVACSRHPLEVVPCPNRERTSTP